MAMVPSGKIFMSTIAVCLTFRIDLSIFLVSVHFPPYGVFFSRKYRTGKCMLFQWL